eukprot:11311065-Ditylum_brightwellii.AAC.1
MGNDGSLHVSQVKVNKLSINENINLTGTGSTANCNVDPCLGTYQTTTDVPVVRAATAVQISVDE